MSQSAWQELMNIAGIDTARPIDAGTMMEVQPLSNRLAIIGTTGAGKSSHVAGLVKAADRRVSTTANTDYPFRYIINEGSSNIIEDVAALRDGRFPPKTPAFRQFSAEPGLTLEWRHQAKEPFTGRTLNLWTKRVYVPICDLAGEDLAQLIDQVRNATNLGQVTLDRVKHLMNIVNMSAGYIIVIKATRARGLGKVLEDEPTQIPGTSKYPDANLTRMLYKIIQFKRNHPHSPHIKGIAVVVTAWDGLAPVAKEIEAITGQPFNPLDTRIGNDALEKFVYACFPSTHAAIKSLNLKNVQYFPSFFEVERDSRGNPICWDDEPGSPKIKKANLFDPERSWEDNVNTILDSEFWFFKELDWLQQFAALG
jgi:hypothetical protein